MTVTFEAYILHLIWLDADTIIFRVMSFLNLSKNRLLGTWTTKMEQHEKMRHYAVADWLQVLSLM